MLSIRAAPIGELWNKKIDFLDKPNQNMEAFELYCKDNPKYELNKYGSGEETAINFLIQNEDHKSYNFLAQVIQREGITALNYGNKYGITPLHYCVFSVAHREALETRNQDLLNSDSIVIGAFNNPPQENKAIALCHLGVDVNLTNSKETPYTTCTIPKGTTPLWLALEKTHNLDVVLMLLFSGANSNFEQPLSQNGQEMLDKAKDTINSLHRGLLEGQKNSECLLSKIHNDIVPSIQRYSESIIASKIVENHANSAKSKNLPVQALFDIKSKK